MAEGDYRRLRCRCGIELVSGGGRGRPRKHCDSCSPAKPTAPQEQACQTCGGRFFGAKRKFCRPGCRPVRRTYVRKEQQSRPCEGCGASFTQQMCNARFCSRVCRNRAAGWREVLCEHCHIVRRRQWHGADDAGRFCSRACAFALGSKLSAEVEALRRIGAAWRKQRAVLERAARVARSRRRRPRPSVRCPECMLEFSPLCAGVLCSDECRRARKKERKRLYRLTSESGKRSRRIDRQARKARKRGATVERFDDLEILRRDRWRCRICGVRTPRELRGTCEPNAPEVDHIVALANGGAHARWNVQCACRACNGAKRAHGQISLL